MLNAARLALLGALLLTTQAASAAPSVDGERWYDFVMNGQKVGYLRTLDRAEAHDGQPARYAEREAVVRVRRLNVEMKMHHKAQAWFTPQGAPLELRYDSDEAGQRRTVKGRREGGAFVATLVLGGGRPQPVKIPLKPRLFLSSAVDALTLPQLKLGYQFAGEVVDEGQLNVQPTTVKVTAETRHQGQPVFVVEEKNGPILTRSLVRKRDRVRLKASIVGTGIEFRLTTRAQAEAFGTQTDVFSASLLTLPRRLHRSKLKSLRLALSSKSSAPLAVIQGPRQAVKRLSKTAVELTLGRLAAPKHAARLPLRDPAQFLKPTPYEDLADPAIKARAHALKKKGGDLWGTAKAINRFVHKHIKDKDLSRAYSTASEVLKSQRGDCTEHSVLFSALAKAAGIPTRLVTGLVYVDGPKPVFGYHEWVEIWTGRDWLAMDPTFGQDLADPTHVRFAVGQSNAEGLRDAGLTAARIIGDLQLSVLEARER